jgi:S1-C subfamily serine protease
MSELKFYRFILNKLLIILIIYLIAIVSCIGSTIETNNATTDTTNDANQLNNRQTSSNNNPIANNVLPSLGNLVSNMESSVVSISVDFLSRGMFYDYTNEGSGTGFIIKADGYIVTNNHVIQDATDIEVTLQDGSNLSAQIIGSDPLSDLAVIKIDAIDLPIVSFGDSNELRPGDWVITIGNALALKGGPSVTLGIISGLERSIETENGNLFDLIQTDAAINNGNSGGPLITLNGKVVGINTAVLRGAQGIGFAVSSNVASPIIESLISKGKVVRPLIGLTGTDLTAGISNRYGFSVTEGIIITKIEPHGPADKSGLQAMDIITGLNGNEISDMSEFLMTLWSNQPGDEMKVSYNSNGKSLETIVQLIERP